MYHIVMATDNNYAQHLGVAMVSLFANNKDVQFKIWIFESGIEAAAIQKYNSIALKYHQEIECIHLDLDDFKGFPISSYYSLVTYFRLRLGDFLGTDVKRALYIDSDAIVCSSIRELLDYDLCGNALAAVKDTPWMINEAADYLWHNKSNPKDYFNAGVLMIDMQKYREANVFDKSLEIIKTGRMLKYLDQDILNLIFEDSWIEIPCKWNVLNGLLRRQYQDGSYRAKEIMEGIQNRAIVHYSAKEKPWTWNCENPLKREYFKYLRISPWKSFRIAISFRQRLSLLKRSIKRIYQPSVFVKIPR